MYDVIIIGAGPAGATLARLLRKDLNILLIEKRNLTGPKKPDDPIKCCGGLLAPDAQKMLAKLGLGVPKEVLTGPQIFSVKTIDFDHQIEKFYQRHYINVDREEMDRWLVSLIPGHVEIKTSCSMKSFRVTLGHVEVDYREAGETRTVKGRILVGADGALSQVRRQGFPNRELPQQYVSIQEWFETQEDIPYFTSIFDRKISDFYSWTIQKGKVLLFGSAIPIDLDANTLHEEQKDKLKALGFDFSRRLKRTGTMILRPRKLRHIFTGSHQIPLIGEAAGLISPSSAEGISYGLLSGKLLAESINENPTDFHRRYHRLAGRIKINILWKNMKSMVMYTPWIRWLVLRSGILGMEVDDQQVLQKGWRRL